ncbi:MAG: DUF1667 domain-containing protein [Clostridia bacterium]|nr:DUF1667 domain-containing protein [Clostridia bacterium]MBO4428373.1 DUF1667 domain-containing protein [Clostridia bacterium]
MEKREMICINCPMGCMLETEKDGDKITVRGNTCPRGEAYAIAELTHPTRTLTSTVAVSNRAGKYVAVKSKNPISKGKLFDAMKEINKVKVEAPIKAGDVVIADLFGESDIIATSSLD